ncbi:MAG TPA: twin-arginine translocase TatA/TatE family subunit [Draconibacterium sp.]|nr:twin-arginine translocase TatA/TatE family subunit [Draconibacterium sp.]
MNLFVIAGFIGPQEVIIILIIVLLLFGGRKIPELMKGLGKGMKEFKNATKEDDDEAKSDPGKIEN